MKKSILIIAISLLYVSLIAQNKKDANEPLTPLIKQNRCATHIPSAEWNTWFNDEVKKYKEKRTLNKVRATSEYVIPVIFHIVSGGQTIGTYPNVLQSRINSQIDVLNADFAGVGHNTNQYATMSLGGHLPFYDYAISNNLPAPDSNGVVICNTGISFCLVKTGPNGNFLAEPGIDRVNYNNLNNPDPSSYPSLNPGSPLYDGNTFTTFLDNVIKPQTIWDPTQYFNIWLTDCDQNVGILGYSTFPEGTSLPGLYSFDPQTTDGCWIWSAACGATGTTQYPSSKGRTLTHETGHYLGLRHIWGDTLCGTDYCNDTPPVSAPCSVAWTTPYPYNANTCNGSGSDNSNGADGEMFMNFMDYSEDAALWMFTNDQLIRMQTALTQSPYRSNLTNSSNTLCTSSLNVSNNELENNISIFPNPGNGQFTIAVNLSKAASLYFTITNVLGQVVYTTVENNVIDKAIICDLSSFNKGIYFITINDNQQNKIVKKIVTE